MHQRVEKALIITSVFLGILVLGSFVLNYTGFVVYPRGGFTNSFNIGAGGSLSDWYYRYAQIFDFLIFLLIFLGVTQMVMGEQFKNLNKSLVVGVGIFLALALVLWESRTNRNLFELFGPFSIVILVLFILLVIYKQIKGFGGAKWTTVSAAYIIFYILFFVIFDAYQSAFLDSLRYYLPFDIFTIASIIFGIAVVIFFVGILSKITGGKP